MRVWETKTVALLIGRPACLPVVRHANWQPHAGAPDIWWTFPPASSVSHAQKNSRKVSAWNGRKEDGWRGRRQLNFGLQMGWIQGELDKWICGTPWKIVSRLGSHQMLLHTCPSHLHRAFLFQNSAPRAHLFVDCWLGLSTCCYSDAFPTARH